MTEDQLQALAGQNLLQKEGYYSGKLDGIWGPLSRASARAWLAADRPAIIAAIHPSHAGILSGAPSDTLLRLLAAQIYLAHTGHYTGKVDAIWGPLSRSAVLRWHASGGTAGAASSPSQAPRTFLPYDVARQHIGVQEIPGKENHPLILRWLRAVVSTVSSEETAWCSAFVNHCAREAGYESTGSLAARSWLQAGEPVALDKARIGDVVILWRVSKTSWQGHVAFLDHYNAKRGLLYLLGGNQSNAVNITAYGTDRLLGIRRLRTLDRLQGGGARV